MYILQATGCPIDFLENLSETFVDSSLHGLNVIILGDLNLSPKTQYSPVGSTFGLSQLVKIATRVTEKCRSLIDLALTTKESIIHDFDVMDHV